MSSDVSRPQEAYVWIWLPGETAPVVAGRIQAEEDHYAFAYGKSYMARNDAIPIYLPELPLLPGTHAPEPPLRIANALRDATPDAWGRRVSLYRFADSHNAGQGVAELAELTFMLRSGSDRIGALDFQTSARNHVPREADSATLRSLLASADRIDRGLPLAPDLAEALQHGTSIGGARPKALIRDGDTKYVAKFPSSTDTYSSIKAEFVAMRLAGMAGLNVAPVRLVRTMGKDVLLIRRFDREWTGDGWTRHAMVSALTLLGLDELFAAHASYEALSHIVRARFTAPTETLKEVFSRMTFNILVGNTDDHARNHAAFWDGNRLTLTPAYDICPQSRVGREASQGMRIRGLERRSQLSLCLATANRFLLPTERAMAIMRHQIAVIGTHWNDICDEAEMNAADRRLLWRRQFLNDLAFEGMEDMFSDIIEKLPESF